MSNAVKTTPARNPFYISPEMDMMGMVKIKKTHTRIFRISGVGADDSKAYCQLMYDLIPGHSNFELNANFPPSKTWTKEGDMLVHVDYVEFEETEPTESPDDRSY